MPLAHYAQVKNLSAWYTRFARNDDLVVKVSGQQPGEALLETSGEQTTPPYDLVNLTAALTVGHVSAGDVACNNLVATGDAPVGAFSARVVSKTAAYTATTRDHAILVDASAGNVTVTLPAVATCHGLILHVKKTDSSGYYVRLDGNSSDTIDGSTTFDLLLQCENLMIQSSGSRWNVR